MSNYPAPPPPDAYGQTTPTEPPPAIKTAVNIVWAVVAISVVSTILTVLFLDDLVAAAATAAGADLNAAKADAARSTIIVSAIIGFLIFGALWILLGIFLRRGANWARIVLTVLAAIDLVFGLFNLTLGQPAVFLVLSVISMLLYVALLVFMWRRESSDYIAAHKAG